MEMYDTIKLFIDTVRSISKDDCMEEDVMLYFYGKMEAYADILECNLERVRFTD